MLSDDKLNQIGLHLQDLRTNNPQEIVALNRILRAVYDLPSYQDWLSEDQFHITSPENRFVVPDDFGIGMDDSEEKNLLDKYMLINALQLTVKIDMHKGRIHLTDGNWVPVKWRVFPYADESELLIDYAYANNFMDGIDLLIDPACGCGHHALGTPDSIAKVSIDRNLRAISYCRINTMLAGSQDILFFDRDISLVMNRTIKRIRSNKCLIMVNMPFALYPPKPVGQRPPTSDGGQRGSELTLLALQTIEDFISSSVAESVIVLVLCYTLGQGKKNSWEVQHAAEKLFTDCNVTFDIQTKERLWRVNGKEGATKPNANQRKPSSKGKLLSHLPRTKVTNVPN